MLIMSKSFYVYGRKKNKQMLAMTSCVKRGHTLQWYRVPILSPIPCLGRTHLGHSDSLVPF